jgi:predicted O-linked N-acetylglucosamine transferase (SPINDLY family)
MGESFASRMAASLLKAVGLPELITHSQAAYESLAIELATNPQKLDAIKSKLITNLPSAPLYNTKLFTQYLESAYENMYRRYQNDLDPEHIVINTP